MTEFFEAKVAQNLKSIAYENYHAAVFHTWLTLDDEEKFSALKDRYVFLSVCTRSQNHLTDLLKIDFISARQYVLLLFSYINKLADSLKSFSEEWFSGIDKLSQSLVELNFLSEAKNVISIGLVTGAIKFPRIAQSLSLNSSYIDAMMGNKDKAADIALYLLRRPYLLPNKKEMAQLYHKIMFILSASNHLNDYRFALWKGVSSFHSDAKLRDNFVEQINKTYRGTLRALIQTNLPLKYRIPFLFGNLTRLITKVELLRILKVDKPFRWLHLVVLYMFDSQFLLSKSNRAVANSSLFISNEINKTKIQLFRFKNKSTKKKILITRAMGGIGDILMMTPGLIALANKYPNAQIDFAIPKSFHSILQGLEKVNVIDINEQVIDVSLYQRWVNLTNCPAGKVESKQYPNVRSNRIEIFARAMGISKFRLKLITKGLPYFNLTKEESIWAKEYLKDINDLNLPVVGIQPFSADSYKNWPYMEDFVRDISQKNLVLIFHHEDVDGFDFNNVHKVKQPLRNSVALAKQCKSLVVVDSSFHHFAGALGIPTVSIFGATSGKVFSRYYPNIKLATPEKSEFPCYPCWRNEHKPCHLTNGRESICFRSISIQTIKDKLQSAESQELPNLLQRVIKWIKYGVE